MRTSKGLQLAKRLLDANKSIKLLALEIYDIYDKHDAGEKLTEEERFLMGLRFSEFFAATTSDEDLWAASEKREQYLKFLNIDERELREELDELWNITKKKDC